MRAPLHPSHAAMSHNNSTSQLLMLRPGDALFSGQNTKDLYGMSPHMNMPLQYPTDSKGRTATFEYPLQPNINIVS